MRKLQKSKISILLTLLMVSTFLMVFTAFPAVFAGPDIPEESEYNGWHWGIEVGDELYFEAEFTLKNETSGEIISMFRDIWIYNISSIENVTMQWLGIHQFSVVNATRCYYDPVTMDLIPYYDPEEYAIFNYNETDIIHHRYRAGMSSIPQLLPLNNSALELDILAPIVNQTMYSPLSTMIFNPFDSFEYNLGANSLLFENSSHGYYAYAEYYGNNGTLKYGETSVLANMDGPIEINATFQRVFDYDITDEVEWGVNVGDSVYYDYFEGLSVDGYGEAYDLKFTITNITDDIVPMPYNSFDFEATIPMVFQFVLADIYIWNGTDYEFDGSDFPMGAANNFYSTLFEPSPPYLLLILPISATIEDLEFTWNTDKLRMIGAPLDTVELIDGTELEFNLSNSTGSEAVKGVIDKTTGFYKSFTWLISGELIYYEQKEMTVVDWSLEPGDIFYYKVNEDDHDDSIIRATVVGTYFLFLNMTLLELDSGGLFSIPSGQPELQFFSALLADFDIWNPTTEMWESESFAEPLGIANIYWPLSPLVFIVGHGFPLAFPIGSEGSDFSGLFSAYSPVYDEITYGSNYVILVNTTLNRQMNFYIDSTSGMLTYLGGWVNQPGSDPTDWSYTSVYPLKFENLTLGVSNIDYESSFVLSIDFSISFNITSLPFEHYYALFPLNPVYVPLPNGTALCFLDQIISHPSAVSGNITMSITFPSSINLATTEVYLFAWNISGLSTWEMAPPEAYEIDLGTNSIIVSYIPFSADSLLFAISYVPAIPSSPGIPGYSPFLLIMGLILTVSLLIRIVNKKKFKFH
jgi:hypothetical protein